MDAAKQSAPIQADARPDFLTEREFMDQLRRKIAEAGGQSAWGRRYGLSPGYVHDVLNGRRPLTDTVAASLGFMRRSVFLPLTKTAVEEVENAHRH